MDLLGCSEESLARIRELDLALSVALGKDMESHTALLVFWEGKTSYGLVDDWEIRQWTVHNGRCLSTSMDMLYYYIFTCFLLEPLFLYLMMHG